MTRGQLLFRNLGYHWRANLAIVLGVAVGTAVLTGALLVGDSLRGSLRELTLRQLVWVDAAMVGGRFVREELASQLTAGQRPGPLPEAAVPAILLQGAASSGPFPDSGEKPGRTVRRAGRIMILGVDERFLQRTALPASSTPGAATPPGQQSWNLQGETVVLNASLAAELGIAPGDPVTLHLQKVSAVPRETLVGNRDPTDIIDDWRLTVGLVLPDESIAGFSLNPTPATPRNALVPLGLLQARLHQEGRVNALLAPGSAESLQASLRRNLTLDDWGLTVHTPESRTEGLFRKLDRNRDGKLERNEWQRRVASTFAAAVDRNKDHVLDRQEVLDFYAKQRNYLDLESRHMILEPAAEKAALAAAKDLGLRTAPTLIYLANSISDGTNSIPYSVVAALDPAESLPLGPFLPEGVRELKDGEIVLAAWKESPLKTKAGDAITLTYFQPEEQEQLREKTATFRLRGFVPLDGVANDPDLTPEFPGITDKLDLRDWNPPFPYDNRRVQARDERFWEQYRTAPKAYVTLADGQKLWGGRFGDLTSIRFAPGGSNAGGNLDEIANKFRQRLLDHLAPEQGGLVFDDVRQRGLEASAGFTNFGELFLYFSFFLIAAALLLVGLLFRLNLDRRGPEIGLLLAAGYRRSSMRWLLLGEGTILAAVGGLLGLAGAFVYATLMLRLLHAWWPAALDRSFLRLYFTATTFTIGYLASVLISILTIVWAVRILGRLSPPALLGGQTPGSDVSPAGEGRRRWSPWVIGVSTAGAIACLIASRWTKQGEERAMTFFGSGALLLTASLAGLWAWMRDSRTGHFGGHGTTALARLGVRNARRYPLRSLLTAGLLASATFLLVAVESFHRDPEQNFLDIHAGSGGFSLLAESDVPIFQDLNTAGGRDALNIPADAQATLRNDRFYGLRLRAGDDASCLNLYQPRRPRLVGVPHSLIERGGFQFQDSEAQTAEEKSNPWLLLEKPRSDDAIPVFADANTVQWMLHSSLGGELTVPNDQGEPVRLRFVGLLQESIFQSGLLLSEANFLKLYPRQEGYQFFLIQAPPERMDLTKTVLEGALADHGFYVTSTAQRLESYLAVENTYLATFQLLGGLGLVLGALGLAVVLMRSVWERRGELALLRALGFRASALGWLILAENSFLLVIGLALGTLTALLAVAPQMLGERGTVPWARLAGLLAVVLIVGLAAGAAAVVSTLRAPLLVALRRE